MRILSNATRALIQDVARAYSTKLDYIGCVGRAAQVLHTVGPKMPGAMVWILAEELVTDTIGPSAVAELAGAVHASLSGRLRSLRPTIVRL